LLSGSRSIKQIAIYARVSSNARKDDLERQLNLRVNAYNPLGGVLWRN